MIWFVGFDVKKDAKKERERGLLYMSGHGIFNSIVGDNWRDWIWGRIKRFKSYIWKSWRMG